ncbi:MAG: hypothetical protein AAGG46_09245 [Planctomycetota bacterium]
MAAKQAKRRRLIGAALVITGCLVSGAAALVLTDSANYSEADAQRYQAASRRLHNASGLAAGPQQDGSAMQELREARREFAEARIKLDDARESGWLRTPLIVLGGLLAAAGLWQIASVGRGRGPAPRG